VCWLNLRPYNTHKLAFGFKRCVYLWYSNQHKGYKCLDSSSSRVYISWEVIFDKTVFPFSTVDPNVGALLKAKISLLHATLCSPLEGEGVAVLNVPNAANTTHESFAEIGGLVASNSEQTDQDNVPARHEQVDSGTVEDPDIDPRVDSELAERTSDLERITSTPVSAPGSVSALDSASNAAPRGFSVPDVAIGWSMLIAPESAPEYCMHPNLLPLHRHDQQPDSRTTLGSLSVIHMGHSSMCA
jgi:hypothetical protein